MNEEYSTPEQLITWLLSLAKTNNYLFRGIDEDKQMIPKIIRDGCPDLSFAESALVENFIKCCSKHITGLTSPFDCAAYAQHFGLPTRLIDWTRNPLVALFFSINNFYYASEDNRERKKPKLLILHTKNVIKINEPCHLRSPEECGLQSFDYAYDYSKFTKQVEDGKLFDIIKQVYSAKIFIDKDEQQNAKLLEGVKQKIINDEMIIIETSHSNNRITAQEGLFYFPKKLDKKQIQKEYQQSKVCEIEINYKWVEELKLMLEAVGITTYKLFDDLTSICKQICDEETSFGHKLDSYSNL